jgi:hypothetical protein
MRRVHAALDAIRAPAHTGENRCRPCTAVNLVVAAGMSVGLGGWVWLLVAPLGGLVIGGAGFALAVGVIYVRGYLVPGTPTLTKRYLPRRVLGWFDKDPGHAPGTEGAVDTEAVLCDLGALEACDDGSDLCVTPSFRADWHDAIDSPRTDATTRELVRELLGVEEGAVTVTESGRASRATIDRRRVGPWESEAAFRLDAATASVLADRDPTWNRRPVRERGRLLTGMRVFADVCPDCGGRPAFGTETVESCCSTEDVVAVECGACGARLFETPT